MAAFTDLTTGTQDIQDVGFLNEMFQSYRERRLAVGDSSSVDYSGGEDIQKKTLWSNIQSWIYGSVSGSDWVDHTQNGGDYEGEDEIDKWDWSSFLTEAGMRSDGFRRATTWPTDWTNVNDAAFIASATVSDSYVQAGDILGPWIFDDIQRAFTTMKWTRKGTSGSGYQRYLRPGEGASITSCSSARTGAKNDWDANSYTSESSGPIYGVTAHYYTTSAPTEHNWTLQRRKGKIIYQDIPSHVAHEADLYFLLEKYGSTFNDMDGVGKPEDKLYLYQSFGSSSDTEHISTEASYDTDNPEGLTAITCPTEGWDGAKVDTTRLLLKWDFTHSN